MATITDEQTRADLEPEPVTARVASNGGAVAPSRVSSEQVWRALAKASFAVLSYVTPAGEPRSSGIMCVTVGRHLYVATAPDSWKARHITHGGQVAVTVPVRQGGLLSLLFPLPPATISFHGRAIFHPPDTVLDPSPMKALAPLLPPERRTGSCIIEIVPEGRFVTYGLGVSLLQMRSPAIAGTRVPVS